MLTIKVKNVLPIDDMNLLVFFENDKVKKFNVKRLFDEYPEYKALEDANLFESVKVEPGGYGISWNSELDCSEGELYNDGIDVPVTLADFEAFVKHNLVNTKEVTEILGCSKQNVDDLVRRGKLHPIKSGVRYTLFLKSEVERRNW